MEDELNLSKPDLDELFTGLYNKIRHLAARVRWNGANPTLNPTALANEAYLKLCKDSTDFSSRSYEEVIAIFANAMRHILIDAARRKNAQKRGVLSPPAATPVPVEDALTLQDLLEDLKHENPRQCQIIDCRFYLGMTVEETAAALGLSKTMVEREWREAKARLTNKAQAATGGNAE
ncbi:MAG: sigma-70 family RNA polymerase sigma factor [Bryobacteraceae bacterium]|jgi:RNA polymerase sigma factor (TIGR02999 family)